ncbi:EAL domain-containing protein [Janthinobacterium sp.]|uniref:putative bifunctional diguanylate cyclase/phosphodiesterase n=1 Tax=Janthinobacterium sp. TaxID=1871054 RepID=UPI002896DE30|nr:EAL domain-containing protein [Janthinobacterium sp.]
MTALLLALCALLALSLVLLFLAQWQALCRWRGRHAAGQAQLAQQAPMLALLQALPAAVIGTDRHGMVRYLNARALALGGVPPPHGVGASVSQLLPLFHDGAAIDAARQVHDCVAQQEVVEVARGAVLLREVDGKRIDVHFSCAPLAHDGAVLVLHDVSARRRAEQQLEFIAHHDGLTGLPNRLHFQIRFEHGIAYARRHQGLLGVLFVDIDRFKAINDGLGHDVGDQVLAEFARRVQQCVRKVDTVARQGGDEFIILLTELHHAHDAERVAEKIIAAVASPFVIGQYSLSVAASVGLALYPDDDDDVDGLIEKADLAMYAAKRRAPGSCLRYAPRMQTQSYSRTILETALRHALERNEFMLHYQPRMDLATRAITGVKALLRWKHPELGLVMPLDFLPVLEESALILPVGAWVLATAVEQARHWIAQGHRLTVTVSLSARQFYQRDIARNVGAALAAAGVPGSCIELEIAAGTLIDHSHDGVAILRQFRQLGMAICISDFGTGDGPLHSLHRFPVDAVKIEKCFIDELGESADDGAMVRAMVAMAHTLKLRAIAGGVESARQLELLADMGCDAAFGYHLGRATAPDGVEALLGAYCAQAQNL